MNFQTILYWIIGAAVVAALGAGVWFYFLTPPKSTTVSTSGGGFGVGDTRNVTVLPTSSTGSENTPTSVGGTPSAKKIFKVTDGPVTSATLIQTYHPTTTIARYVQQENGHTLDLVLDNSGVVARAVSNTTIPGTAQGHFAESGNAIILQYLENTSIKSIYLGFPATTTSTSSKAQAVRIQFFPDNITDYGISPDGKNVVYLLAANGGSDGYTAKTDGTNRKKIFSVPFSQVLVSWPAPNVILLQTKSLAGVNGVAFSVNAQTGSISPLVYAPGLTAIADATFTNVVYQKINSTIDSYVHSTKTRKDIALSFNPIPEKCVWSKTKAAVLYCASPLEFVVPGYLDQWHQGAASAADSIFAYDVATGRSQILATPGEDGGVATDVVEMAVSPDDHYLLFLKKGDRSLWALRLTQ